MSQLINTLKQKNKVEKTRKKYRNEELAKLRRQTAFKARLYDELKKVDILLDDENINGLIIEVPEKVQSLFTEALYSEDLIGYEIKQLKVNTYLIKKKIILF